MCLPCFPWTWTQYEDPLDSMPEHSIWVHDGQAWVLQQIVSFKLLSRALSRALFRRSVSSLCLFSSASSPSGLCAPLPWTLRTISEIGTPPPIQQA